MRMGLSDARAQLGAKQVLNQLIVRVAEKLSALRTASYFQERAAGADVAGALDLLGRAGDEAPRDGDEITG